MPRRSARTRGFPPQARGWTPADGLGRRCRCVSPAGAGMDPLRGLPASIGAGFPRRRGDGPVENDRIAVDLMFPPQARGWTLYRPDIAAPDAVSPAGAGMDPGTSRRSASSRCFPRRRGDGPALRREIGDGLGFPPQARGWTGERRQAARPRKVSPAGAGMDLSSDSERTAAEGFPRRRGDGPRSSGLPYASSSFPPQARGWTPPPGTDRLPTRVSPAGAGMDLRGIAAPGAAGRFPRRRGDGPPPIQPRNGRHPFPPQARGWTRRRWAAFAAAAVSPAGAGMDRRPGV